MLRRLKHKRHLKPKEPFDEIPPVNYARFHVISGDDPATDIIQSELCPSYRSGHRIFTTRDYLYSVGGFDLIGDGVIYKEVWRMNLLTRQWFKMNIDNPRIFPSCLASFSICQTAPFSNEVILYGGTWLPFGQHSSDDTYLLTMLPDGRVLSERLETCNPPRAVYGHAMVQMKNPYGCKYYAVGGTTGHNFFLDVHSLNIEIDGMKHTWKWEHEGEWGGTGYNNDISGLYRLECVIEDGKLIMFGGGTPDYVQGFDKMYYFDLIQQKYSTLNTIGDPNCSGDDMYPIARRCHSITRWGRKVIMAGGCGKDVWTDYGRTNQIYDDVWIFDLDTYQWERHASNLSVAVFFHAAAITIDGCLLIHGGVTDERSQHRTNTLQVLWIAPPNLLHWSFQKIVKEIRKCNVLKAKSKKTRSSINPVDFDDVVISCCDRVYSKVMGPPT